ncbi:MAG: DNA primase [Burkholderiaceae bacterium]
MIPQSFISDLLARVDVVDVVGRYVQLKKGGQNQLGLCPFHNEKSPSFTVSPSKQFYHCFGCGAHGSAIGFLMEYRGLGYVEAIRELAQSAGLTVPDEPGNVEKASRTRALTDLMGEAAEFYKTRLKASPTTIDYLKNRGVSGVTAARFSLGFSPDSWQPLKEAFATYEDSRLQEAGLVIVGDEGKRYDRFRGRLMFPIRNSRGAVIGFGARVLGSGEPKYLNSPETPVFHKGQELYGLFEGREAIRANGRAVVVEGYMDVIQLSQAGFDESVAALGTAVTSSHVATLLKLTDHVVFAFDGDNAGRKAARRALEAALPVIGDTQRASFLLLPEGEDPDSLIKERGRQAFEEELGQALPLSRFFLRALGEGKALDTSEGRAALLAEAKPLITAMPGGAMRLQLMQDLAHAARTELDEVEALYGLRRARSPRRAARSRPVRHVEVEDLKQRILQYLLAHPLLAREFNAQIVDELVGRDEPTDEQIVEVWRAATAVDGGMAPSQAALMEGLGASQWGEEYRHLAAREMMLETPLEAARQELSAAFLNLELQRVSAELEALISAGLTAESRTLIQRLMERQAKLKAARQASAGGSQ